MSETNAVSHKQTKAPLRNFRFRKDLDAFLAEEAKETARDMTVILELALKRFKALSAERRAMELLKYLKQTKQH